MVLKDNDWLQLVASPCRDKDWLTHGTIGKSRYLNAHLRKRKVDLHDLAISKQLQIPRSSVQTTVFYWCLLLVPRSVRISHISVSARSQACFMLLQEAKYIDNTLVQQKKNFSFSHILLSQIKLLLPALSAVRNEFAFVCLSEGGFE